MTIESARLAKRAFDEMKATAWRLRHEHAEWLRYHNHLAAVGAQQGAILPALVNNARVQTIVECMHAVDDVLRRRGTVYDCHRELEMLAEAAKHASEPLPEMNAERWEREALDNERACLEWLDATEAP